MTRDEYNQLSKIIFWLKMIPTSREEIKSYPFEGGEEDVPSETLLPVYEAQIISYLKLANKKLGFLVNFNVPLLKKGFKRFVNNF